jgi:cadmium resistance protein CadD (predicted permease)
MLFIASISLGYVTIELDSLALFIAFAPVAGLARTALAYLASQLTILVLAILAGQAAGAIPVDWVGLLGLIPIMLGLRGLWQAWRGPNKDDTSPTKIGLMALFATFAASSVDTLIVLAAFLADSTGHADIQLLIGVAIGAIVLFAAGFGLVRAASSAAWLIKKLKLVAPFVMIISGFYILTDTGTDTQ